MRSSWPIVVGIVALGAAAFWYDARNAEAARSAPAPASAAALIR
jgi:hypothetical protein